MNADERARLRALCERREEAWMGVTLKPRSVITLLDALEAVERERDKARAEVARLRATAAEAVTAEIATRMQVERALRGETVEEPRCDAVKLASRVASELRDAREQVRVWRSLARDGSIASVDLGVIGASEAALAMGRIAQRAQDHAAQGAATEREACAVILDEIAANEDVYVSDQCADIAAKIRARGTEGK